MKKKHQHKNKRKKEEKVSKASFVRWRFIFVCWCAIFIFVILVLRAVWLQVIISDNLTKEGNQYSIRTKSINIPRGMILDRTGRPLAVSVPVGTIWADPKESLEQGGVVDNERWQALAEELQLPLDKLREKINNNPRSRFIYLARQVNPELASYIKHLKLPGVYVKDESRRFYPAGEITAHLIGFTNIDGKGIEGLEKSFNSKLSSQPGKKIYRKDRFGRVVEDIASVDGQAAHNLTLSIDERLQAIAYRELSSAITLNKAESGSAVLIDVNTGEVLAMVNNPSYNPNNRAGIPVDYFRDRAITDAFEPGSTVKPLVVMKALEQNIVKPNSVINTIPYYVNGHQIKDVALYRELSVTGIIQKSSNVGVSKMSLAMPINNLLTIYSKFGLGQPTKLGLPGEINGFMPHRQRWADIERATFAFGYGLMVTPLQLARAYATIGSGGIYRPLSITKVDPPVKGERVISEDIVKKVIHMMESVALPGGGGVKAAVRGYRVAIKTGTAKKVGPNGRYINKYIAYTAGIAPASNPRFALVIVINDPSAGKYYGGSVSAPVFSSIMGAVLRTMDIEPDALPSVGTINAVKQQEKTQQDIVMNH